MKILNFIETHSDPFVYKKLEEKFSNIDMTILADMSIITDDKYDSIAWIIEPPLILDYYTQALFKDPYITFQDVLSSRIYSENHKFKKIYTHFKEYSNLPNVHIVNSPIRSWVSEEKSGMFVEDKKFPLTFITSLKQVTPMQRKRVLIAKKMNEMKIPVYGKGISPIDDKSDILRKFYFCFSIENQITPGYHTEKILDCFRTGTVPIYAGDPEIGKIFNTDGIIMINPMKEDFFEKFEEVVNNLNKETYFKMLPAITENFEISMKYIPSFENTLEEIVKNEKKRTNYIN